MEVTLVNKGDIEDEAILSIRAGSVRRQAPVSSGRPFRFPKAPTGETPLKIDILKQVGTAYLVQKPGEDQYKVEFSGDFKGKCIEVEIKKSDDGAAAAAAAADGEEEEKDKSKGAKAAKDYLEGHQVLQFVQAVLQTVIKEKPADPFAYMAKHFMSGYGPMDTKTPKKPPAEDDTPNACFTDIAAEDMAEAKSMGDLMGARALVLHGSRRPPWPNL